MTLTSSSPSRSRGRKQEALIWPPLRIGQRKPTGDAPKNTFPMLDSSLQEGAEGIAIEVQISPAGDPVVHCETPSGRQAKSAKQVRSLAEILRWVRSQKCTAYVSLCASKPGSEGIILQAVKAARPFTRVVANNLRELRRIRELDPTVHLGLRFSGRAPNLEAVKALGAEVLLPHSKVASPAFIRRAHRSGLLVIPWTVDSPRLMRRAILDGVDGIFTNHPARLAATVARLQKASSAVKP